MDKTDQAVGVLRQVETTLGSPRGGGVKNALKLHLQGECEEEGGRRVGVHPVLLQLLLRQVLLQHRTERLQLLPALLTLEFEISKMVQKSCLIPHCNELNGVS